MTVRTRFAPSPTGNLHLGGVRTALFNYLFAKKMGGTFILRIEDTDVERSTDASTQGIFEAMTWLGLNWEEGPFYQTQRMEHYWEHLDRMKAKGAIYPAFDTKEELEEMRNKAMAEKRNPIYDRRALKLSPEEVQAKIDAGVEFVWRFKVPDEGYTEVNELLMGGENCRLKNDTIGDFVITRPGTKDAPGMPLYNFVCAVDDALMKITHVIRGVEHLTNAARQVLLLNAMGYTAPTFVHLPLITKNGKKMSKRDIDADGRFPVSANERRELGYLPEAVINYVALLGWNPKTEQEIFTLDELAQQFDLKNLNKSNANFDEDKFLFINSHYLKNLDDKTLVEMVKPYLIKAGLDLSKLSAETLTKVIVMEKERCKTLSEFPNALAYFFDKPKTYDEKAVEKFFKNPTVNAKEALTIMKNSLKGMHELEVEALEAQIKSNVEQSGLGFSKFGPIVRLALTGRTQSPGLAEVIEAMGQQESIERLEIAEEKLLKTA